MIYLLRDENPQRRDERHPNPFTAEQCFIAKSPSKFWDQPPAPSLLLVALTCWRTVPFCYIPFTIQQLNPKQPMCWVSCLKGYLLRVFRNGDYNGDYLRLSQCLYSQASPAKHLGIFFLVELPSDPHSLKVFGCI